MLRCKPCITPYLKDTKALYDVVEPLPDPTYYRQLIGKIPYLTNTRPDLCFCIHLLSQFMQTPIVNHYVVIQQVLRYIKANLSQGLFFLTDNEIQLKAFIDFNWGTCQNTKKSTIGFYIFPGSSLVSCKSKKQGNIPKWRSSKGTCRTPWCSENWMSEWRQVLKALASYGRWRRW